MSETDLSLQAEEKPAKKVAPAYSEDAIGWSLIGLFSLALFYCYFNTLQGTAEAWKDPMWNFGFVVPVLAALLLYLRREPIRLSTVRERWIGAGIILFGTMMRVWASHATNFSIDRISLVVVLLGVFVMVGGWRILRWAGAPIAFLAFMFPLPGSIVDNLLRPLQTIATMSSVYVLQTLGMDVFRDGNRIIGEATKLNVVDQCSGLRMLTVFIALAVAMVLINNDRPWWERIVILLSAVPIAVGVNVIRISMTGVLYSLGYDEKIVNQIFHDFSGLIMMPLALAFLFIEMKILANLIIEDTSVSQRAGPELTIGLPT